VELLITSGFFVNKIKIHDSIVVNHGDVVQLGKNGPEFKLEIDPPPPEVIKSTRLAEIPTDFIPKTREATIPAQTFIEDPEDINVKPTEASDRPEIIHWTQHRGANDHHQ
jgi:hypothetical protein